jgi:hypothetical protein
MDTEPRNIFADVFTLSEADREEAQRQYLLCGQATIFIQGDGSAKFVPMSEFAIEVAT